MPTIESEEQALELIELALDGQQFSDGVEFSGWPILTLRVVGDHFNGSLDAEAMKGLIALQTAVYRTYALMRYGIADARRLTEAEKKSVAIVVSVSEGSTILGIDMQALAEGAISETIAKMNPDQAFIISLTAMFLLAGGLSFRWFLNHRRDVRRAELDSDERRHALDRLENLSSQETERLQMVVRAMRREPTLKIVERQAQNAKIELLKGLANADFIELPDGQIITGDVARELVANPRRKSDKQRIDGMYRLGRFDPTFPDHFKVKLIASGGDPIDAVVRDDVLEAAGRRAIQEALLSRQPLYLEVQAKIYDSGVVGDAEIIGVTEPDESDGLDDYEAQPASA